MASGRLCPALVDAGTALDANTVLLTGGSPWADPPPNAGRDARLARLLEQGRGCGSIFVLRSAHDGRIVHAQTTSLLRAGADEIGADPAAVTCFGQVTNSASPLHAPGQSVMFPLSKAHAAEDIQDTGQLAQLFVWITEWAAGAETEADAELESEAGTDAGA